MSAQTAQVAFRRGAGRPARPRRTARASARHTDRHRASEGSAGRALPTGLGRRVRSPAQGSARQPNQDPRPGSTSRSQGRDDADGSGAYGVDQAYVEGRDQPSPQELGVSRDATHYRRRPPRHCAFSLGARSTNPMGQTRCRPSWDTRASRPQRTLAGPRSSRPRQLGGNRGAGSCAPAARQSYSCSGGSGRSRAD
jgi:hypothetical protein